MATKITKTKRYWIERERRRNKVADQNSLKTISQLRRENIAFRQEIIDDVAAFYQKFADRNNITLAEAKRILNKTELKGFYAKLKKWKEQVKISDNPLLSRKIDAMLTRSKIQRLEQLVTTAEVRIDSYFRYEQKTLEDYIPKTAKAAYADFALTVAAAGVKTNMGFMQDAAINRMLDYPLTGQNFSADIWEARDRLAKAVQKIIVRGINQGNSYSTMSKELQEKIGGNYTHIKRIVRTETKFAVQQGKLAGYEKIGVDMYEIVSIDDERSTDFDIYDGDKYPVAEATPGVNFPPFHVNCRCDTIAVFE